MNGHPETDAAPKSAKRGKSVPGPETARDKFLRLAPARMGSTLRKIRLIGNLAGSGYEFEKAEAKQMIEALSDAVNEVANKFDQNKSSKKGGFSFGGGR